MTAQRTPTRQGGDGTAPFMGGRVLACENAPLFARFALWSAEVDSFGRQIDDFSARIDAAIKRSTPLDGDKM